jgi:hypothetical protein
MEPNNNQISNRERDMDRDIDRDRGMDRDRDSNRNIYRDIDSNRDTSYFFKSPEIKNQSQQGLSFVGLKSARTYGLNMVSPTYKTPNKEFTSTLRHGNKSSSKIRLRSANSFSINTGININNNQDNYDLRYYSNLKTNQSREKSKVMSSYGDNSKIKYNKIF